MRGGQQVQNRVGGPAHGNIQRHGILERLEAGNVARQHAGIILLVIALGVFHDQMACALEQLFTVRMGRKGRAIARQRQSQGFGQAVHGIGGEHART